MSDIFWEAKAKAKSFNLTLAIFGVVCPRHNKRTLIPIKVSNECPDLTKSKDPLDVCSLPSKVTHFKELELVWS